jgi:hypothetical protein
VNFFIPKLMKTRWFSLFSLEEYHVLCNQIKNNYMSYATQKQLQRSYFVSTLTCTGM